jgi:hypothetical protein
LPERLAPAETLLEVPPEFVVNVRFPLAPPLDWGWKVTVSGTLCPAASVSGKLMPLTANSELVRVPDVTVMLVPEAVNVSPLLEVEPTVTFPKLSELGDRAS